MMETVTEQNTQLSSKVEHYKNAIMDLEDAQELYEELDAQQRAKIESDRLEIEGLNKSIKEMEKTVLEKEYAVIELNKTVTKWKEANRELKRELGELEYLRSIETTESKSMQQKLLESVALRANQDLLVKEVTSLYSQFIAAVSDKNKHYGLFARLQSLFGSNPHYLQETKLVYVEMNYLSTVTVGFDALRMVTSLFDSFLLDRYLASSVPQVAVFTKLHLLLLRFQNFSIKSTVHLFRQPLLLPDQSNSLVASADKGSLFISSVKILLDRVINISSQLNNISKNKQSTTRIGSPEFDDLFDEEEGAEEIMRKGEIDAAMGELESVIQDLYNAVKPAGSNLNNPQSVVSSSDKLFSELFKSLMIDSRLPAVDYPPSLLDVETLLLSANSLCDNGIYQCCQSPVKVVTMETVTDEALFIKADIDMEHSNKAPYSLDDMLSPVDGREERESPDDIDQDKDDDETLNAEVTGSTDAILEETVKEEEVVPPPPQKEPILVQREVVSFEDHPFLHTLRSIKIEIKTSITNLKAGPDHYVTSFEELKELFSLLLKCFAESATSLNIITDQAKAEELESSLKAVLQSIRKINAASGQHVSSYYITSAGYLRYFPINLMTKIKSYANDDSDVQEEMAFREIFVNHVEKFWNLL